MKTKKIDTRILLTCLTALLCYSFTLSNAIALDNKTLEPPKQNTATQLSTAPKSSGTIAIIPLKEDIDNLTAAIITRLCKKAIEQGATQIVLDIDTPGGLVYTTLQLTSFIKGDLQTQFKTPITAWVHPRAYSAGSIISAACNQIVMSSNAQFGDSAPVMMGQELAPTERAKALSPILSEIRSSAKKNGYAYPILHAMCALDVEVYKIKHSTTGEIFFVNQADYNIMVHGQPISKISKSKETREVGAAQTEHATKENQGQFTLVKQIHDGTTLLTMGNETALEIGISQKTIDNTDQLKTFLNAKNIIHVKATWSEDLAAILCSNMVRSVLTMLIFAGIFLEIKTAGIGIGTTIAVSAIALLILGPYTLELSKTWHLIVLALGIALILAEVFVIPGFGVAGISGILCLFVAIAFMAIPTFNDTPLPSSDQLTQVLDSFTYIFAGLILSFIPMFLITKFMHTIPFANMLILAGPASNQLEPNTPATPTTTPTHDVFQVGQQGKTISRLSPTGQAIFNDNTTDVSSEDEFIDANTSIAITKIQGNKITVISVIQ